MASHPHVTLVVNIDTLAFQARLLICLFTFVLSNTARFSGYSFWQPSVYRKRQLYHNTE